jgi:hypothetical protein
VRELFGRGMSAPVCSRAQSSGSPPVRLARFFGNPAVHAATCRPCCELRVCRACDVARPRR